MIDVERQDVHSFEVFEYTVRQLIPATGFNVVYAHSNGSGVFTVDVVAWGLVDERCRPRVAWKADGRHFAENDGPAIENRKVLPLVLDYETGELRPPTASSQFLGVCRVEQDAAAVFADELESYRRTAAPAQLPSTHLASEVTR